MSSLDKSMSHTGEDRKNYTMAFKCEAIEYAENNSNHKAAKKSYCCQNDQRMETKQIFEPTVKPKNKRLEGRWKKPLYLQLENQLIEWIYDRRSNRLHVSKKLIMVEAKYFYKSECDEKRRTQKRIHAAKRDSKSLYEEFKSRCVVKSSGNAWMKKELTTIWVK